VPHVGGKKKTGKWFNKHRPKDLCGEGLLRHASRNKEKEVDLIQGVRGREGDCYTKVEGEGLFSSGKKLEGKKIGRN